jgi:hypothetical protein
VKGTDRYLAQRRDQMLADSVLIWAFLLCRDRRATQRLWAVLRRVPDLRALVGCRRSRLPFPVELRVSVSLGFRVV